MASLSASEFSKWTISQLKAYLQAHGVSCSEHKKAVLQRLCETSLELSLPIIKTPDDYLQSTSDRQTVTVGGEKVKLPPVDSGDLLWSENLAALPDVEWPNLIVYLMEKCGWSTEQVKQYRDTRGFALKDSNHIGKVKVHEILNTNFMYVKAECDRQTSLSEKPYIVWLLMKENGHIESGGCQCTG